MFDKTRNAIFPPQRIAKPKAKSCKRIIKRDEHGRIKSEEFVGCSKEEVKMMKDNSDDSDSY